MSNETIIERVVIPIKNCKFCKYLEFYAKDGWEDSSPEGFYCVNRNYRTENEEKKHLEKLEDEKYRLTPKKCCEIIDRVAV